MYAPEQVAQACGAPLANVQRSWPVLVDALQWQGIDDHATRIALAATVAVETGVTENGQNMTFLPVTELGGASASYAPWYGRGYIQCTWESNYALYGPLLNPPLNLLASPDLLLQPVASAQMAALYFKQRGIPAMANAGNWLGVRVAVNGGTNGLDVFLGCVNRLLAIPEPPDVPPVTTVVIAGALKTSPSHSSTAAIGPKHTPVQLAVGTVVHFTKDRSTGQEVTPLWACIAVDKSPIWGWYPRASLQTIGD